MDRVINARKCVFLFSLTAASVTGSPARWEVFRCTVEKVDEYYVNKHAPTIGANVTFDTSELRSKYTWSHIGAGNHSDNVTLVWQLRSTLLLLKAVLYPSYLFLGSFSTD